MRLSESKVNPLPELLKTIPTTGVVLSQVELTRIALFFNAGGVFCESFDELYYVLSLLEEYKLIKLDGNKIFKIDYSSKV